MGEAILHIEFRTFNGYRAQTAALIRLAKLHLDALNPAYMPIIGEDFDRGGEEANPRPFPLSFLNLALDSCHFISGAAVDDQDLLGPETLGHSRCIYSGIAATDNCYSLSNFNLFP